MKTTHWQAKLPGDVFWINVPAAMVASLQKCGYKVLTPGGQPIGHAPQKVAA